MSDIRQCMALREVILSLMELSQCARWDGQGEESSPTLSVPIPHFIAIHMKYRNGNCRPREYHHVIWDGDVQLSFYVPGDMEPANEKHLIKSAEAAFRNSCLKRGGLIPIIEQEAWEVFGYIKDFQIGVPGNLPLNITTRHIYRGYLRKMLLPSYCNEIKEVPDE